MPNNNWYVITGGPSSGKTTLLAELEKLGYVTVPEAARTWIDQNLAKGISVEELRKDEQKFQDDIVKLKIRIENELKKDVITFLDRGMHDSVAYFRHYGYEIKDWVANAMKSSVYRKVFLLDPLPVFEKDYARTEDENFPAAITGQLDKAYREAGMKPIRVSVMSVKERLDFILQHVGQDANIEV